MKLNVIAIYKDAFAGLSKEVYQLAFMMFINRIGTLILPFLTLYTTQELNWTVTNGGIAASAFGFGSLVGAYLGGIMTDRIGYYRTMVFGLFSATFIFFITQYFSSFYIFCALLFLGSMVADTLRPALYSGLSYITDDETQTRAISLLRMAFNLGIAIGPAVAGLLVVYTGYRSIFIIDAATCLLAGIYMLFLMKNYEIGAEIKEKEIVKSQDKSPYKDGPFILFLTSCLLMLIAFFQIVGTVPLYIKEFLQYTEKEVGLFFTVNGLIIFLFEMLIMRFIEKRGVNKMKALILGAVMMGASLLFLALPNVYLIPFMMYTLLVSFGEIINFPFISTTSMNRATDQTRGKYMGLTSMMFSLSLILAPVIGTMLLEAYGYNTLWIVMFVINMVGVVGFYLVRPMLKKSI